ncbi:MAG: Tfp pilus assembly protein FimT/FimU [Chthoniobacteraceae bacterium]
MFASHLGFVSGAPSVGIPCSLRSGTWGGNMLAAMWFPPKKRPGFTLLELIVVIAIVVILTVLTLPSLTSLKGAGDMTRAASQISGALDLARTYAAANNTYTWVGFYEENANAPAPTDTRPPYTGKGRVIVAMVASKDGSQLDSASNGAATLTASVLTPVQKFTKLENVHVTYLGAPGGGSSDGIDGRPAASALVNSESADATDFPITLNGYTFYKTIRFSPRGEAVLNGAATIASLIEIGLEPTRGNVVDSKNKNVVAIQVSGIVGNVRIYRR